MKSEPGMIKRAGDNRRRLYKKAGDKNRNPSTHNITSSPEAGPDYIACDDSHSSIDNTSQIKTDAFLSVFEQETSAGSLDADLSACE